MPAPLPAPSPTAPAQFDASAVESWLADHPRKAWDAVETTANESLASGTAVETVVSEALAGGLSWQVITDLISAHDGRQWTKAGVHKKYRHLEP